MEEDGLKRMPPATMKLFVLHANLEFEAEDIDDADFCSSRAD
jgi:hypothetical protein